MTSLHVIMRIIPLQTKRDTCVPLASRLKIHKDVKGYRLVEQTNGKVAVVDCIHRSPAKVRTQGEDEEGGEGMDWLEEKGEGQLSVLFCYVYNYGEGCVSGLKLVVCFEGKMYSWGVSLGFHPCKFN